jgi:hypothetical protein
VYEEDPVTRIEIKSTNVLNITIDTSSNPWWNMFILI